MIINDSLKKQSERILRIIRNAEEMFEEDDEMRSHLAKYICILCSGFLENSIHSIYSDYVKKEIASDPIISFSTVYLNKINNPSSDKFRELARHFNTQWESELSSYLKEEERSAAINYIIRDRHKIAHGKDSEITLSRIRDYHLKTVDVIIFIEKQCGFTI